MWTLSRHWIVKVMMALLISGYLTGCATSGGGETTQLHEPIDADKYIVYFYKQRAFTGSGRTHILKVDDRTIGEMKGGNYFKLELWPGDYKITQYLPRERTLGIVNHSQTHTWTLRLSPVQPGKVLLYKFKPYGTEYDVWRNKGSDIKGRTMARYLSAQETAQVKRYWGGKYEGPAMNGAPHGEGRLTYYDGSVYKGPFEEGEPTERGRLQYPDGRVYTGGYHKGRPHDNGILRDRIGNVLFAGSFSNGAPHGEGISQGPDGPELRHYRNGRDVSMSPAAMAKKIVADRDQKALDAIMAPVEEADRQIGMARERLREYEGRYDTRKSEMAERCYCVFNLCLTSRSSSGNNEEWEERRARRRRICREWADAKGDREAEFQSRLDSMNAEIDRKLEVKRQKRRQAELEHRRRAKEYERTREMRLNSERERLLREKEAKLEEKRQWCQAEISAGRLWCSCGPFLPVGEGGVCMK